ncbi:hypothetical protein ACH4A8_41090 [Streptomyces vietnamensis]|uniref:hypothetical protein n=1 Tax=Streptomyces vietnamensis TaxID=362257 RepID=UPI00378DE627
MPDVQEPPEQGEGQETADWISDADSFFRHLPRGNWGSCHGTACGINLGPAGYYLSRVEMIKHAAGKPRCSACIEGVRV